MPKAKTRKRPCKICKKWFMPDVRPHRPPEDVRPPNVEPNCIAGGAPNTTRRTESLRRADYLQKKARRGSICTAGRRPKEESSRRVARARIDLDLPGDVIGGAIGLPLLVVIEYVVEQILRKRKMAEKTAGRKGRTCGRERPARRTRGSVFKTHRGPNPAENHRGYRRTKRKRLLRRIMEPTHRIY